MYSEIIHSIFNDRSSDNINLMFFGIEPEKEQSVIEYLKKGYHNLSDNHQTNFLSVVYNISKYVLPKYSNKYSKHKYTLPQLMGIFSHKIRLKLTYKETIDDFKSSSEKRKALNLKDTPDASTLQRFFKKSKTEWFNKISDIILSFYDLKPKIIALDGTGYTHEQGDIYYRKRANKKRIGYTKNHISIETDNQLILYGQSLKGLKHDSPQAIPNLKMIKKYKPEFVVADKWYDAEKIKKFIMEDMNSLAIIPVKKNPQTGKYRLSNYSIFRPKIYGMRNLVETVNSVQKRIFSGKNTSRSTTLRNKETKIKNMLYNIYRTLIIIEKSNKNNKIKPKNKTDNTTQTKIEINNETNIMLNITNKKQQNTIIWLINQK